MSDPDDTKFLPPAQPDERDFGLDDPCATSWLTRTEGPPTDERVWVRVWPEDIPDRVLGMRKSPPQPASQVAAHPRAPVDVVSPVRAALAGIDKALAEVERQAAFQPATSPDDWIDQNQSPLGSRRHRRLVREGKLPGSRDGKKVLVRRADLDAYIRSQGQVCQTQPADEDEVARELRALGLGDDHDDEA